MACTRPFLATTGGVLQRKCDCGSKAGCASCKDRHETVQRSAFEQRSGEAPAIVHEALRSPGQSLDVGARSFIEPRLGYDFSRVRVHTDARAGKSAATVSALAYTVGNDIVFGPGQYSPATHSGRRLLAHELVHVIQQSQSGPGLSPKLEIGLAGDCAEREADDVAARVMAGETVRAGSLLRTQRVQRKYVDEPAGGCGVCEPAKETGKRAHTMAQDAFGHLKSVGKETTIYYAGDEENGRLDLVRVIKSPVPPYKTEIEIGEIKPNNFKGMKSGYKDLDYYKSRMEELQVLLGASPELIGVTVMKVPAPKPPLAFRDPTSKCPSDQAFFIDGPFSGVYGYSCSPPRSSFPKKSCCDEGEKDPVKKPIPLPSREKKKQKEFAPNEFPILQPTPGLQPVLMQEILEFVHSVVETGGDVKAAVWDFLTKHPEIVDVIYAAAAAIFIANIIEDIVTLGWGLLDEPLVISVCWEMVSVANAIRAASLAPALVPLAR